MREFNEGDALDVKKISSMHQRYNLKSTAIAFGQGFQCVAKYRQGTHLTQIHTGKDDGWLQVAW